MLKDFSTPAEVDAWVDSLDERWPERRQVKDHIAGLVGALPTERPRIVELAPGSGPLGQCLLEGIPGLVYTGVDNSSPLLERAKARLAPFGQSATLVRADLNDRAWLDQVGAPVDGVVSMQALHDLGSEDRIERIYRLSRRLLAPGGIMLNADLVVPPGGENPARPGRLTVARHLELLVIQGYEGVRCSFEKGQFGCCLGFVGS